MLPALTNHAHEMLLYNHNAGVTLLLSFALRCQRSFWLRARPFYLHDSHTMTSTTFFEWAFNRAHKHRPTINRVADPNAGAVCNGPCRN